MTIRTSWFPRVRASRPALVAACVALAATTLPAQQDQRWEIRSDAFTDLWYFGLALAGEQGPGPLPMYASARATRWTPSPRLSGIAGRLGAELSRDSTLEVLHSVPLHLVGVHPLTALNVIQAALEGTPKHASSMTREFQVAAAVAATVSARARPVAAQFAEALAAEWKDGLRDEWLQWSVVRAEANASLQARWETVFMPVLRPFLATHVRGGALVIVSPSVGLEGRVLRQPAPLPVLAIVSGAEGYLPQASLMMLTRELTFPCVDAVMTESDVNLGSRAANARLSRTMAVRSGAMLLAHDSLLSRGYANLFLDAVGKPGASLATAFPLDAALERALGAELFGRLIAVRPR